MNKSILILTVVPISIALASVSCKSGEKANIIGLNQSIHHDDFDYSVTAFETTPKIETEKDTIIAKGMFYIVHFKVANNALRVGHRWDNSIAYMVDEKAKYYENIEEDQDVLNSNIPFGLKKFYNTPHGSSDSTILVFDIPSDSREPCLMVRGEILMGDAFDGARFRKMKVKLF
jgi:hypothetical protein